MLIGKFRQVKNPETRKNQMGQGKRGRKGKGNDYHAVVKRIFDVLECTSQPQICAILIENSPAGPVKRQKNVFSKFRQDPSGVSPDWLYQVAYLSDVEMEWLLTGMGEKDRHPETLTSIRGPLRRILDIARHLSEVDQQVLETLVTLLASGTEKTKGDVHTAALRIEQDDQDRQRLALLEAQRVLSPAQSSSNATVETGSKPKVPNER